VGVEPTTSAFYRQSRRAADEREVNNRTSIIVHQLR
jgi:hypothetical protein